MVPELPSCSVGSQRKKKAIRRSPNITGHLAKDVSFVKPRRGRQGVNICFCGLPLWPMKVQVTVTRTHQPQILSEKKNGSIPI